MSDLPTFPGEPPPDQVLDIAPADLTEEEERLRVFLEGGPADTPEPPDGRLCAICGQRPARVRVGRGRPPVTCQECHDANLKIPPRDPDTPTPPRTGTKTQGKVDVSARASKKDRERQQVEDRAKQLAQGVAVCLMMVGQVEDATVLTDHAGEWAGAVGGLAPYEPWLVKLCAGGEASGRVLAWIAVVMATLGLTAPILLRHGVIPEGPLRAAVTSILELAATP